MSLFDKALAKGTTAAGKKKDDKEIVTLTNPKFHADLSRLAEVNSEIDALSAESAVLSAYENATAIKEFKKLYVSKGKFPGSFILRAAVNKLKAASLMFITADRYIMINEERANELKATYGEDIVEAKTTFVMDTALVEKHGKVISDLIEKCKSIPEDDKNRLISAVVKLEIKKGTVSEILTTYADHDFEKVVEDIKPIFSLKGVRIED